MSRKYTTGKSFSFAFSGLKEAFKNEPNFRIHLLLAIIVLVLGITLNISAIEYTILVITISFVLISELINTTLEALVDLVSPEIQEKAKVAKDVSAGAVLISAITAILVGLSIFLPKLLYLI